MNRLGGLFRRDRPRVSGEPGSPTGASSFHLWWELARAEPLVEVSAVLEVLDAPAVDRLYFWALQAGFQAGADQVGGGHLGLQWNRLHPRSRAANWGGYQSQALGGRVLEGSMSVLPSAPDDPNTRDLPWEPDRAYRLRIGPTPARPGLWRGEITDLETGRPTVVRDLYGGGTRLGAPVMWSEVFARCDHPSVTARWSDLRAVTEDEETIRPPALRVTYQSSEAGGCANTDVAVEDGAVLQITNTERATPEGAVVRL